MALGWRLETTEGMVLWDSAGTTEGKALGMVIKECWETNRVVIGRQGTNGGVW
jgi:hypothetical protein